MKILGKIEQIVEIDAPASTALTIGPTNATTITIGRSGQTVDFDSNVTLTAGGTIDTSTAGTLSIGATNATTITIGRTGQQLTLAGDVVIDGNLDINEVQDDTFTIVDEGDETKSLNFSLGGATTSTQTTIVASQTTGRSITLPDATDTLVGKATTDDLTNKTYASADANAADAGIVRLGNTETLAWRNAANSGNITLSIDGSDEWSFNGTALTTTELGYVAGVTSALQTQLDAKLDDFSSTTDNALVRTNGTAGEAVQDSGILIDDTDNISAVASLATTGTTADAGQIRLGSAQTIAWRNQANSANITLSIDGADEWNFNGTALTTAELGYVAGVTSAIQTQLDAKLDDFTSTTDNALMRSDGTGGAAVQDSGIIIDDSDNVSAVASLGSAAANPADAGALRLGNTETLSWRNAANSGNITLSIDGSDEWSFNGTALSTTELGYVAGVTSAIQTQLDAKLDDFTSSTDNAIVRTSGTAGEVVQDSGVLIDDSDNVTGVVALTATGAATLGASGVDATINGNVIYSVQTVSLASNTFAKTDTIARVTTGTDLHTITGSVDGEYCILENKSGANITIVNENTAAADNILTGTGSNLTVANDASVTLYYDGTAARWQVLGGSGAGGSEVTFTETSHAFAALDAVYHDGSNWQFASSASAATAAEWLVTEDVDANTFKATKFGEITATSHGLTVGEHYFLTTTATTGNTSTTTEPTTGVSSPLFKVIDANTVHAEIYRPSDLNESLSVGYNNSDTATNIDSALPISHGLGGLPKSLELWVETATAGEYEQHDPATYLTVTSTQITATGTTLASVLGGTANVIVRAMGVEASSVSSASASQAGVVDLAAQTFAGAKTMTLGDTSSLNEDSGFSAYRSTSWDIGSSGVGDVIVYDTEIYDTNGDYDASTGVFTAPVEGYYMFSASLGIKGDDASRVQLSFTGSTRTYDGQKIFMDTNETLGSVCVLSGTAILKLAANDTVDVSHYITYPSTKPTSNHGATTMWFQGRRLL